MKVTPDIEQPDNCLIAVWHGMPEDQRTKERRRPLVEQLRTQGYAQQAIAMQFGVNQARIARDLTLCSTHNVKGQGKDTLGRKRSTERPGRGFTPPSAGTKKLFDVREKQLRHLSQLLHASDSMGLAWEGERCRRSSLATTGGERPEQPTRILFVSLSAPVGERPSKERRAKRRLLAHMRQLPDLRHPPHPRPSRVPR
jgi:hypothetical protein